MGPKEDKGGFNLEDFLDGTVSILGLDLDLVQLLSSPRPTAVDPGRASSLKIRTTTSPCSAANRRICATCCGTDS